MTPETWMPVLTIQYASPRPLAGDARASSFLPVRPADRWALEISDPCLRATWGKSKLDGTGLERTESCIALVPRSSRAHPGSHAVHILLDHVEHARVEVYDVGSALSVVPGQR
jgi:hypothetical protein